MADAAPAAEMHLQEEDLRRIIGKANLNALRMALIEEFEDPVLYGIRPLQREIRGGAMSVTMLNREQRSIVTERAVRLLMHPPQRRAGNLDERGARRLLDAFGQPFQRDADVALAIDDLGIARGEKPDRTMPIDDEMIRGRNVAIIGAGISGIALAIRLKQRGIPFRIYERHDGIGGTWHLNDYPESRVDISTFIYQFGSEKNYAWSDSYARQPEIKRYLDHIVDKHEIRESIELGATVRNAKWNTVPNAWQLEIVDRDGCVRSEQATFLFSAVGLFNTPNLPTIRGLERFQGATFHTTDWHHQLDLTDKAVALVGNGSSGVQIMPWLSRTAARLTVFQRSPNWLSPVEDYREAVHPELHMLFAMLPSYWRWHCFAMSALDKQLEHLQVRDAEWHTRNGTFNARNAAYRDYLEGYIRDQLFDRPDLLEKSIPAYPPLARRMIVDSGWYQALKKPNVELVTDALDCFEAEGAITVDGARRPLDVVVLGTGFRASDFLSTLDYVDENGKSLTALWERDGARAYLGMFLPDFPNFGIFYGPNGQPQSGSFHNWADRSARTVVDLVSQVICQDADAFRLPSRVYRQYNASLDAAMHAMIWGRDGASGYYINEHGRPITKMPWPAADFFEMLEAAADKFVIS